MVSMMARGSRNGGGGAEGGTEGGLDGGADVGVGGRDSDLSEPLWERRAVAAEAAMER